MKQLRNSVVKWLVVSLLCLLLGFFFGKFKQTLLDDQLAILSNDLETLETRNSGLETDLSRLQASSDSDQQAVQSLLESNKQLQDELAVVNNKLFFYERVIAPELKVEGLKIHSFEIIKNAETQLWDYELVLMQSQKNRRLLSGKVDISFSIFEGDELKLIPLKTYSDEIQNGFKFKYFQTIEGSFLLPEEVTIDEVVLKLSSAGNRWYKAQHVEERYDWRVLTTQDIDDLNE